MSFFEMRIPSTRAHTPFPEPVAAIGSEKRREQDVRMLKSPEFWPHTTLPLKKSGHAFQDDAYATWDGTKLYVGALFAFGHTIKEASEVLALTAEEVVERGWTVD